MCFFLFSLISKTKKSSNSKWRVFHSNLKFLHNRHYSQHEDSVAKAREGLQQRLSTTLYESGDGGANSGYSSNRYTAGGSSGNNKYVTGCSTCYGIGNSGNSNADSFSSR